MYDKASRELVANVETATVARPGFKEVINVRPHKMQSQIPSQSSNPCCTNDSECFPNTADLLARYSVKCFLLLLLICVIEKVLKPPSVYSTLFNSENDWSARLTSLKMAKIVEFG